MGRFQAFRFVIQHVKQDGMKVIASAGLDDRVQFLKELSADVAFNYKTTMTSKVLAKEDPIDVYIYSAWTVYSISDPRCSYWDNIGGESLEAALNAAADQAQFIVSISPLC